MGEGKIPFRAGWNIIVGVQQEYQGPGAVLYGIGTFRNTAASGYQSAHLNQFILFPSLLGRYIVGEAPDLIFTGSPAPKSESTQHQHAAAIQLAVSQPIVG